MDPLTALGLVANIVPFIEIAAKVLKTAKEIHDSESGGLDDNVNLEKYATQLKQHYSNLLAPDSADLIGDDKELCALAAECQKLAHDLLGVLERIKLQSFRSALKNLWRGKDKEMLEKRLESCRTQVEAQLNQRLRMKIVVALKQLLDTAERDNYRLKQIESYIANLREGVRITSLSKEAQDQLRILISTPEAVIHEAVLESFVRGIIFDGIHERFEMVASGDDYEFDWIQDDPYWCPVTRSMMQRPRSFTSQRSDVEGRNRQRSKELFSNWLSFGKDIFHISAKLGAGKSTLMKNLCTNAEINFRLSDWAGDKKLATGKFFFWNFGSRPQKSLAGLSRTLLCDVLRSYPELLPSVFGSRWNEALAMPWQTQRTMVITDQECIDALERLIINFNGATSSYRFCFFIDGLDELQETPHFSFRDLSQVIKRWAQKSGGNVKFCVSSREYNQFMDEFDDTARVRLHDLTKQDMMSYVHQRLGRLGKLSDTTQRNTMARLIVGKAQGVFLWVALVVRDLSEKLHDGFCGEDLAGQIHSLPDELDSLFDYILKSLRKDTPEVYKLFLIMMESSQWGLPCNILAFTFLGSYEKDPRPDFFLQHKPKSFKYSDYWTQSENCKRNLIRCSRGLIEAGPDQLTHLICFQFIHRSVQDFLLQPKIKAEIEGFVRPFNTKEALSQITCLAQRAYGRSRAWEIPRLLAMREAG
ncbi:hypothetical protein CcaCcLH18_14354 [Colletotrichum camelliae]|nr:hypothetical protein CcaCcLH18_14354 [Colletotrichum camelliae]